MEQRSDTAGLVGGTVAVAVAETVVVVVVVVGTEAGAVVWQRELPVLKLRSSDLMKLKRFLDFEMTHTSRRAAGSETELFDCSMSAPLEIWNLLNNPQISLSPLLFAVVPSIVETEQLLSDFGIIVMGSIVPATVVEVVPVAMVVTAVVRSTVPILFALLALAAALALFVSAEAEGKAAVSIIGDHHDCKLVFVWYPTGFPLPYCIGLA